MARPKKEKPDVAFTSESRSFAEAALANAGVRVDRIITRKHLNDERGRTFAHYGDIYLLEPLTPDVHEHVIVAAQKARVMIQDRTTRIWV